MAPPRPWLRPAWPQVLVMLVMGAGMILLLVCGAALVRTLLSTDAGAEFLSRYPGEYASPADPAPGFPAWARWQHFFNVFLMALIVRSGLQVRRRSRPPAYWSSRRNPRRRISIDLWLHQAVDILWVANGAVFVILLFISGHWARIVPTSWEVVPNALSAALQYASLDWPTERSWANYNALQQLAYFATVFVAAPLAVVSGVRMSGIWPAKAHSLSRVYPIRVARAIHFPVMIYFVAFVIVHVALVLATGALRNLNHMFAGTDQTTWTGFWIFAVSTAAVIVGTIAAQSAVVASLARLFGRVSER